MYAIAISAYYDEIDKKHPSRISKNLLRCCERLNIDDIEFPPKIKDIEQFQKDVRVSPYALKRKRLVELLIIEEKTEDDDTNEIIENSHFTTIKNLSKLFQGSKYEKGLHYCKKCYCSFKLKEKLEKTHIPLCTDNEHVLTIMPEKKNDTVKFKDYHMQAMQPFMIIPDFETYTNKLNQINPYSFGMFTHYIFDENNNELTYFTGKNCLDKFFCSSKISC